MLVLLWNLSSPIDVYLHYTHAVKHIGLSSRPDLIIYLCVVFTHRNTYFKRTCAIENALKFNLISVKFQIIWF